MFRHGGWLAGFFYFFLHLGAPGLLLLSALDSSFLTLPFANDLAVVVLTSMHHSHLPLYVGAATLGSLAGCWVLYAIGFEGGESFIRANMSKQRFEQIQKRVSHTGPFLLALPGIVPPPFPFTPWVLAAGALEVPERRFLLALSVFRSLRFITEAIAALYIGPRIIHWMQTASFRVFIEILMGLAILGSAWSVYRLVVTTRTHRITDHKRRKAA